MGTKNRISSRLTAHKKRPKDAQPPNEILCSKRFGGVALDRPVCINTGIASRYNLYDE